MTAPQYPPQPGYAPSQMPVQPSKESAVPLVAGALLIVAGFIAIADWALLIVGSSIVSAVLPGLGSILTTCGIIGIVMSIIALLGGVAAIQRKMWGLALVGSILGLFTIGFLFISTIFSLVALILVAISHSEFT